MQLAVDSTAFDNRRTDNGPCGFARYLASYISDPSRIRTLTIREFGSAPSLERCAALRAEHDRSVKEFHRLSNTQIENYSADNDDGAGYRVRGLVKIDTRKVATPRVVPTAFAETRARQIALRNDRAIQAGPIARDIICRVANHFRLDPNELVGSRRSEYIVSARFVAVRLIAEVKDREGNLRFSKAHIGRIMGGRDHSTILHAVNTFDDRARKYEIMTIAYEALKA